MAKRKATTVLTAKTSLLLTRMDPGVVFGHENDERAFFEWLARIPCVQGHQGDGSRGLVVHLRRQLRSDDLRQLLALCHRWSVDMRQMARFETAKNRSWFCDPKAYWHEAVFKGMSGA